MIHQPVIKVACFLALLLYCSSSKADINCATDVVGLCTPTTETIITEVVTEESYSEGDGITTITTTNTTTTTNSVVNTDSGDVLDGDNDFVTSTKEGDMDSDWGGQGPANISSGATCGDLGADKCAQITGSGDSTSAMGVSGMGTTFIQTIDVSDLNVSNGGKTTYTIKVDKQDSADSIYMHITGKDGSSVKFAGTNVLSAAGVDTGYASYSGEFDFGGSLTSLIVEIGGRDINLAIGPVFDDVSINVIYNVIAQVIANSITTVEQWVSLNIGGDTELELVEDLIDNNDFEETDEGFIEITPNEENEDYSDMDTVEAEIDAMVGFDEIPQFEVEIPTFDVPEIDTNVATVETNIEAEIESQMEIDSSPPPAPVEPEPEVVPVIEKAEEGEMVEVEPEKEEVVVAEKEVEPEPEKEEVVVAEKEVEPEIKKEVEPEPEKEEIVVAKKEPAKKVKTKEQKKADKQKAASKIVKKMKSKSSYYDDTSQQKTLIIMQVVSGNAKDFFLNQNQLQDIQGFFSNLPSIPDGNLGASPNAFAFFGSGSQTMNEMIELQYK